MANLINSLYFLSLWGNWNVNIIQWSHLHFSGINFSSLFINKTIAFSKLNIIVTCGFYFPIISPKDKSNNIYFLCLFIIKSTVVTEVSHSCPALWDSMDCSLPGSSVHADSPGKNTGVGCHFLHQGIFPTQGSNLGLPHCRQTLYPLSHQGYSGKRIYLSMQKTWIRSLGREDPMEKEMATPSIILAWKIKWTEGPGGLKSMGLQRVHSDTTEWLRIYANMWLDQI